MLKVIDQAEKRINEQLAFAERFAVFFTVCLSTLMNAFYVYG